MDREWTDKRMDDFAGGVDRRFDEVDRRFDGLDRRFDRFEADVKDRFAKVDRQFDKADALEKERFAAVHAELAVASKKADKMIWTLIGGFVSVLATVVGKFLLG
jgi:muramoyltetrapeptide carboxypeptidase LdcA involved in peptidoglycan recycling